ncbi:hypothetical protein SODALDRAFT_329267 [Sodiomyces alkalinus F11]|uniref:Protein disulfide-isomerase n=1 Tax=Sodiomyces alkalinus (strain CBS 110278 / VKM F-3762 / F11) TaxID=1314773 RepID=A0A3N2PKQ6_SODAK|nr:hypothetical protein SODALDRAFT_329267 [Sodiomyces alkalinus F11]ROT35079.1 hypothetical protein SODALDRAFT_329267 [Sodiomyces alkalinus F11]
MPRLSLIFSCLLASASAWSHVSESGFREALASNDMSLSSHEPPSKTLESEWVTLQQTEPRALSVDCLDHAQLCAELDVASFPAIRLYDRDGTIRRYRGPKNAKSISAFLKRTARPPVSDVDESSVTEFLSSDDIVFVARRGDHDDTTHLDSRYRDIASRYSDRYTFGTVPTAPGPAFESPSEVVSCFNNRDGLRHALSEADLVDATALESFIHRCSAPLVPEMTRRNERDILSNGKSIVYFFSPSETARESHAVAMHALAIKYAKFLTFVTVDSAQYPEMVAGMGLCGGAAGTGLSVQNPHVEQIFPMPELSDPTSVQPDEVERFIVEISQGKVAPWDGKIGGEEDDDMEEVGARGVNEGSADQGHDEL